MQTKSSSSELNSDNAGRRQKPNNDDKRHIVNGTLKDLIDNFENYKANTALMSFNIRESEKFSYALLLEDIRRIASALVQLGIKKVIGLYFLPVIRWVGSPVCLVPYTVVHRWCQ